MKSHTTRPYALLSFLAIAGLCVLFCGLFPLQADSKIYTWRDSKGRLHITDKPPAPSLAAPRPSQAGQAAGKLFLWSVSSPDTSGYLLGSIHVGNRSMYPLDPRIEKAFQEASVVAIEANLRNATPKIVKLIKELGVYPRGDSLLRHISQKTVDMLKQKGVDVQAKARFRPWALALQLETKQYAAHAYRPRWGVEQYFLRKLGKRRLVALESVESQIRMFSELSKGIEDTYLQGVLQTAGVMLRIFPQLIQAWRTGDTGFLQKLFYGAKSSLRMNDRAKRLMITDRNKGMARGIARLLKGNQPFFAMMGALHMVGGEGVPALLRRQGFEIRQVGATGADIGAD